MDQIKTGNFIREKRKALSLTQNELAEKLNVTDKAISRWETGKGMPDGSLLLPLAKALGVSVNELLSGETLKKEDYQDKAEENMVILMKERADAKLKLILEAVIMLLTLISACTILILAGYLVMPNWLKVLLTIISFVIIILGCGVACVLERDAGYYECPNCKHYFKPTLKAFIFGLHFGTTRRLKCPSCQKTSFCKKRLSK